MRDQVGCAPEQVRSIWRVGANPERERQGGIVPPPLRSWPLGRRSGRVATEPYPPPRPSSIIGPPNAAGNDTAGIGLDVASQPACGKAGRLAQATPAHRPGARSGPPASRAASLASAPRPGPEGPALAPRDCVAYHNPATRPMQKSTKATDPTHNATNIAYSTAIIRQPPEPPQPAHDLTTHSPHRPFHARN